MKTISFIIAGIIGSYLGFVVIPSTCIDNQINLESPTRDSTMITDAETRWIADSLNRLVASMIQVESRGNECAYNGREDAVGCLQIRPIMVREVNRLLGSELYTMNDRWDCDKSVDMLMVIVEKHHKDLDYESIARCWNGGPRGMSKVSTESYWMKVKYHL
jgi:hypothetical protein